MAFWIVVMEWLARGVLVLLVGLSFWSVAIMLDRARVFRELEKQAAFLAEARRLILARDWKGLNSLSSGGSAAPSVYAGVLSAAIAVGAAEVESVERSVKSYLAIERTKLERGFTALATLGSNAPFVGLFGTVLGVIQAFGVLGYGESNTASVMAAISEALIATAVGLFVAIPAVIAYNAFSRKLRLILVDCESLVDLYISRIRTRE